MPEAEVQHERARAPNGALELRPWTPDDTDTLLGWLDEAPAMLEAIGFIERPALVQFITEAMLRDNCWLMAAVDEDELVGYVAAVNIMPDGSAVAHFGLAPQHRGRGKELGELGIQTAFDLGLRVLWATIPRTRAGKLIERFDRRFGFKEPDAKILVLTREAWKQRNGNETELGEEEPVSGDGS